jgi:predicted amidohydrolase
MRQEGHTVRITLAQVAPVLGDVDANIDRAEQVVDTALDESADLIVFPELSLSGYSVGNLDADVSMRPDDSRLQRLAKRAGPVGLAVGFVESARRGPHTYNSVAYYQDGQLVHVHRKLYLPAYWPFVERNHFTPGPNMRTFTSTSDTTMAVLCCNDAWQPQLAFLATQDGAQLLLVPTASAQSAFPDRYDSREYWQDITRFYGRMFQLYVVFVNRVGIEEPMHFWGGSHVVDPWGNLVAEADLDREHLLSVEIDLADIRLRRRQVPLVKEARLGLLQREINRLMEEGGDM